MCLNETVFEGAWQSLIKLNLINNISLVLRPLVFATSGIVSMHYQLVTPKRKGNLKSHHMAPLINPVISL